MRSAPVHLRSAGLCFAVCAALAGCQTTSQTAAPPVETVPAPIAAVPFDFQPTEYRAGLQAGEARYPTLYTPETHAIWITDEVNALKMENEASQGVIVDEQLKLVAQIVQAQFITIECYLESAFADSSVAYDAVGLRNIDVYLETPSGDRVYPLQRIMAPQADQTPAGALVRFGRTTILVFPKRDLLTPAVSPISGAPSSRLVLEGFHSTFYFEWQNAAGAAPVAPEDAGPNFRAAAVRDAIRTGYTSLYTILSPLRNIVD